MCKETSESLKDNISEIADLLVSGDIDWRVAYKLALIAATKDLERRVCAVAIKWIENPTFDLRAALRDILGNEFLDEHERAFKKHMARISEEQKAAGLSGERLHSIMEAALKRQKARQNTPPTPQDGPGSTISPETRND